MKIKATPKGIKNGSYNSDGDFKLPGVKDGHTSSHTLVHVIKGILDKMMK